jgi:hypothetical protein
MAWPNFKRKIRKSFSEIPLGFDLEFSGIIPQTKWLDQPRT